MRGAAPARQALRPPYGVLQVEAEKWTTSQQQVGELRGGGCMVGGLRGPVLPEPSCPDLGREGPRACQNRFKPQQGGSGRSRNSVESPCHPMSALAPFCSPLTLLWLKPVFLLSYNLSSPYLPQGLCTQCSLHLEPSASWTSHALCCSSDVTFFRGLFLGQIDLLNVLLNSQHSEARWPGYESQVGPSLAV
jgi:hypothetical protein